MVVNVNRTRQTDVVAGYYRVVISSHVVNAHSWVDVLNRTTIDWPNLAFSWNPVVGCKRGCTYCYAIKMHNRFNKIPFSEITFYEKRLNEPERVKKPSTIFVGSMSDIEYWTPEQTISVIDICRKCPQHTFMFLSKSPESYKDFIWPKNTMQGLTLTCEQAVFEQMALLKKMKQYPRPYLSIEPILGILHWPVDFELVIVGAMTGKKSTEPKPQWITSIKINVPREKLFWKNNIKRYL